MTSQHQRMTTRARTAVLWLTVAGALAISVLSYGVIQQGQAIKEERGKLAYLTQQLCENLSDSRVAGNKEIRLPLRDSLLEMAVLLRAAARGASTPHDHDLALKEARRFTHLAEQVNVVAEPIDCNLDPSFGTTSSGSGPSSRPVPTIGPPSPSVSPSPVIRIVHVPGPTITITVTKTICRLPSGQTCKPPPSA